MTATAARPVDAQDLRAALDQATDDAEGRAGEPRGEENADRVAVRHAKHEVHAA